MSYQNSYLREIDNYKNFVNKTTEKNNCDRDNKLKNFYSNGTKIVYDPKPIAVNLYIHTLTDVTEQRLVTIDVPALLRSKDITGIYKAKTRFNLNNLGTTYFIITKDTIRNVHYLLFISGTFFDPLFASLTAIRQSTPDLIDGVEITLASAQDNGTLLKNPLYGVNPLAFYANKNRVPGNNTCNTSIIKYTNAIAQLGSSNITNFQFLSKQINIDDKLYKALQKIPSDALISTNKNLVDAVFQVVDYAGASYTDNVSPGLREKAINKLKQYLEGPVHYSSRIVDVFSSSIILDAYALTTIITQEIHRFNFYSDVIISGFKNEWSVLNGPQQITPWYSDFMTPVGWACPDARKFYLSVYFDSSALPLYNPKLHGVAIIETTHQQITDASEFNVLRAAQLDIFFELNYTTHNEEKLDTYTDAQGRILPVRTYQQLLQTSQNGTYQEILHQFFYRTSNYTMAAFYAFPYAAYYLLAGYILAKDNSLEFPTLNAATFDVPVNNYLVPDTIRYPYFRLVPDSSTLSGSRIIPSLLPPGQQDPLNTFYSGGLVRDSNFYVNGQINNTSYPSGLIRTELTGGKRIAYWRINDEMLADPFGLTSSKANIYTPKGVNPMTFYQQQYADMFATYLQSLNIDALILDTRLNFGGNSLQGAFFLSVIGAVRKSQRILTSEIGPNGKVIDVYDPKLLAEFGIDTKYEDFYDFPYVDYTKTALVPTALKNIKVDILISRLSVSAGDTIVPLFYGDKLDGNVGNGVQVEVFGELNGTLAGTDNPNNAPILYQAKLNINGQVENIAPNSNNIESSYFREYLNSKTYSPNYVCAYQPDVLMKFTVDEIKRDIGLSPPCINFIENIAPQPFVPSTWKDSYIEYAIRNITGVQAVNLGIPTTITKVTKTKNAKKSVDKLDNAKLNELNNIKEKFLAYVKNKI